MWYNTFEQRLSSWNSLRTSTSHLPMHEALAQINAWWQDTPWRAYHLHWDDRDVWPDPWELLSDNIYCDLARGLGIMYTIIMLDREDLQDSQLVETSQGNLVLVDSGKYILNWGAEPVVNTNLDAQTITNIAYQSDLKQQLN